MPHDLAKSQVMGRSRVPTPREISFYPVFRQTPSGVDVDLRLFTVQQGNPFFNQAFDIV
jgi:hypothetical protein